MQTRPATKILLIEDDEDDYILLQKVLTKIAGTYKGHNEVFDYFTRRRDHAAGTLRMHPRDTLIGAGDHIGVLTDGTANIDGAECSWSTLGLYRITGDRIAEKTGAFSAWSPTPGRSSSTARRTSCRC